MFLKDLIAALNGLSSGLHDLASAIRGSQPREYDPVVLAKEQFLLEQELLMREKVAKLGIRDKDIEQFAGKPLGKVYYADTESRDRDKELREMEEYLSSRGFPSPEGSLLPQDDPKVLIANGQEAPDAKG
jgi:hypothetical protein